MVQRQSAPQTAHVWVEANNGSGTLSTPTKIHKYTDIDMLDRVFYFFGDNVAFDKEAWLNEDN